jgi:serine/threonine-protein kinase
LSEIEYALYRKRGDAAAPPEIMPVVLEGPPAPPAPESLSDVSFDDYLPYFDSSTAPTVIDERESWSDPLGHLLNNRYFVEERIGAGGFGEVYRARDEQLAARPVVVKTLRADGLNNPWALHKFRHEIEALARLDHPAVVGIFDAGQLPGGAPFLVMQFVNGQSLRVGLSAGGMNLAQAAQIVQQVASALTEAHAQGILHRDLKPENIMLRRLNTGETQAVVIDFGVAKVRNSALAPGTDDGRIAGTYLYMSPEQVMGGRLDATSDVYSLGVVAYEMLTGRRPFAPQSLAQLPEMQRRRMFDAPCDLRPDLPPAAQASLLQALSHNPAHRYQSAQQFGDALARALQQ